MSEVELTFNLREDMNIATLRPRRASAWLTMGLDEDLHEATVIALDSMIDFVAEPFDLDRKCALASIAVDCRVTQITNVTLGVHAILEYGALVATDLNWWR